MTPTELATLAARTSRSNNPDPADMRVMLSECAHTIRMLIVEKETAVLEMEATWEAIGLVISKLDPTTGENLLAAVDLVIYERQIQIETEETPTQGSEALHIPMQTLAELRNERRKRDRKFTV